MEEDPDGRSDGAPGSSAGGKRVDESPLRVLRLIARRSGWRSLYAGAGPSLVAQGTTMFIYFYVYSGLRYGLASTSAPSLCPGSIIPRVVAPRHLLVADKRLSAAENLGVATAAGMVNVVATAPLWVATMRLKMQGAISDDQLKYNGLVVREPSSLPLRSPN